MFAVVAAATRRWLSAESQKHIIIIERKSQRRFERSLMKTFLGPTRFYDEREIKRKLSILITFHQIMLNFGAC